MASNVFELNSIVQLRSLTIPTNFQTVSLLGYNTPGDGGGGEFYYDSSSMAGGVTGDNGGTIIKPNSIIPANPGRWIRIYSGKVNARWFGAIGDGITNDATSIQNALNTTENLFIPDGVYKISSPLVIKTNGQCITGESLNVILKPSTSAVRATIAVYTGVTNYVIDTLTLLGCATNDGGAPRHNGIWCNTDLTTNGTEYDAYGLINNVRLSGQTPGVNGYNACIVVILSNYVTVQNCYIDSFVGTISDTTYGSFGLGLQISGKYAVADSNFIMNPIPASGRHCIYSTYCPYARVSQNTVGGCTSSAIIFNTEVGTNSYMQVVNNQVFEGAKNGTVFEAGAILLNYQADATSSGSNNLVSGNIILNAGRSGIRTFGLSSSIISDNIISGFAKSTSASGVNQGAIEISEGSGNQILNNAISTTQSDSTLRVINLLGHSNAMVSNNKISINTARNALQIGSTCTNINASTNQFSGSFTTTVENQAYALSANTTCLVENLLLYAEKVYDPASIAAGLTAQTDVTVTGARTGDVVEGCSLIALPANTVNANILLIGQVVSSNLVTVTLWNISGSAIDLGNSKLRVQVRTALAR